MLVVCCITFVEWCHNTVPVEETPLSYLWLTHASVSKPSTLNPQP
jgi:hypothetical protein